MCVAAIINKPLSREHLECMDIDNPHGGGVAWLQDGKLQFARGLNSEQIYYMQQAGTLTFPYLLHFRWATHGSRRPELTHPFPTGPRAFYGELRGVADEVLIHNGVWHDYANWEPLIENVPAQLLVDISDTAVAAYFYSWFPDIGDEIPWAVASARVGADGSLDITKHGGWSEHEGNEFSNLSWLPVSAWARMGTGWGRGGRGGWTWTEHARAWNYDSYSKPDKKYVEDPGGAVDWEEYVRARYGDEVAEAVGEIADNEDDAITMCKLAALEEMEQLAGDEPDGDLISEDPDDVNKWLAREFLRREKQEVMDWSKYAKCVLCEVYTRAKDGVCGYCTAQLAKEQKEGAA